MMFLHGPEGVARTAPPASKLAERHLASARAVDGRRSADFARGRYPDM